MQNFFIKKYAQPSDIFISTVPDELITTNFRSRLFTETIPQLAKETRLYKTHTMLKHTKYHLTLEHQKVNHKQ